jgi:hypothetical protein
MRSVIDKSLRGLNRKTNGLQRRNDSRDQRSAYENDCYSAPFIVTTRKPSLRQPNQEPREYVS